MPRYVLQVVVETEEDHTKKAVREALASEIRDSNEHGVLGFDFDGARIVDVTRIYVRREVVKQ